MSTALEISPVENASVENSSVENLSLENSSVNLTATLSSIVNSVFGDDDDDNDDNDDVDPFLGDGFDDSSERASSLHTDNFSGDEDAEDSGDDFGEDPTGDDATTSNQPKVIAGFLIPFTGEINADYCKAIILNKRKKMHIQCNKVLKKNRIKKGSEYCKVCAKSQEEDGKWIGDISDYEELLRRGAFEQLSTDEFLYKQCKTRIPQQIKEFVELNNTKTPKLKYDHQYVFKPEILGFE
jgi:hypothetical protein